MMPNQPDTLLLTRTPTNSTNNITLQVPDALNIAAGNQNHSGQLTIGALPSSDTDISGKYVTVVGGFTMSGNASAHANPLQLFPGWLQSPSSTPTNLLEGALQIGMTVLGTGSSSNYNLLACYNGTAQTATPCQNVTSPLAAPLLGVYSPLGCPPAGSPCSTGGSAAIVAPPSRAVVAQNPVTSGATWAAGTPVCRDTTAAHGSYSALSTTGSCPIGQAVGVAVGDTGCPVGGCINHLVDLDFAPQGTASSGNATTYATAATSLTIAPSSNLLSSDGIGNVQDSGVNGNFATAAWVPQVVGVYNNAAPLSGNVSSNINTADIAGQYTISAYINQRTCSGAAAGSVNVNVLYTDSHGVVTKQLISFNFSTSTAPNASAVVTFWSVGATIGIATTGYSACTTGGTYDIHFALTRLQ
jgi:hypothetical protein